jgi:hypothetical protein
MLQQVLTFEIANGKIKESLATLVEPRRWRDGQLNPELFTAMVPEDIVALSGCDLFWTRSRRALRRRRRAAALPQRFAHE